MLDPWIIEEILRQERLREERREHVYIELDEPLRPLPRPPEPSERGVTIIDI